MYRETDVAKGFLEMEAAFHLKSSDSELVQMYLDAGGDVCITSTDYTARFTINGQLSTKRTLLKFVSRVQQSFPIWGTINAKCRTRRLPV